MSTTRRELMLGAVTAMVCIAALYAMTRVFTTSEWVRPSVGAVLLSTATVMAARRIRLPAAGALVLSLVSLAVFTYVMHLPSGPLIPGRAQLADALALVDAGLVALREQPAPTDALPELVFLVSLASWAVALVAHELGVRLRRPGFALIAPAALWVVPLSMPQPAPATARTAVPFLLACALLLLLESDADLAGWARERIAPRITVAGSAIAIAAVGLGVLAPGILPGYQQDAWLDLGGGSDPRGYQPIVDIGDRLSLPNERTVLRVASDRRVYLRLAALDTFDENTWRLGPPGSTSFTPSQSELFPGDEELPYETGIATAATTVVDVEVVDLENIYVPVPYQPAQINGDAAKDMVWSRVGGFLATGELSENELGGTLRTGVTPGLRYQVVAAIPDPTIDELRAAEPDPEVIAPWLALPGSDGDRWGRYADQARDVYEATGATSTVDRALALQYWFTNTGGFSYSLTDVEPLRGPNPLEAFVFETKTGYCEYFSTAMALMLRATGIPARVAVGFLPGELVASADPATGQARDLYEVRTSDAHAWVEVLFPGLGWIKFDPTPRSDGATLAPDAESFDPVLTPEERELLAGLEPLDPQLDPQQELDLLPEDQRDVTPNDPTDGATPAGERSTPLVPIAAGLLAVAAAAVVLNRRRDVGHGLSGRAAALDAQQRVLRESARLGVPRHPSETATEALHRWASMRRCDPATAAELARIGQQAAFAPLGAAIDGSRAQVLAAKLIGELREASDASARALAPVRIPLEWTKDRSRAALDATRERIG